MNIKNAKNKNSDIWTQRRKQKKAQQGEKKTSKLKMTWKLSENSGKKTMFD